MCDDRQRVADGLATFGARPLRVLRRLDDALLERAGHSGAEEIAFPALSPVADLERIDYFANFPHLGLAAVPLRRESLGEVAILRANGTASVGASLLGEARFFLPSAACYPVYAHLADATLACARRITTVQRCFRNEERYETLARLWSFTMREIVLVGPRDDVRGFLTDHKAWILRFAEGAGIPLSVQAATDPFFDRSGGRAQMQRLFPVKEELVYADAVAIASVNFHLNFFGERWNIRTADGSYAFSGCVAFGLERWLHALGAAHGNDCVAMVEAIGRGVAEADQAMARAPKPQAGPRAAPQDCAP